MSGLTATLARTLGDLGVGGGDIEMSLAGAVEAECILCGITVSGAELISTGLGANPAGVGLNEKLTRLRLGYCCRNGCSSSYYLVNFTPIPGIEWSELWQRVEPCLGAPAEPTLEKEMPSPALWRELVSRFWVECGRKPLALGVLSLLVLLLLIIGGCRVPGLSPKSRVFIVSGAAQLPVDVSVGGD